MAFLGKEVTSCPETGCDSAAPLHRARLTVQWESVEYEGVICYQPGVCRPLVLVLPNVEGMNSFDEGQAEFLAKLGYVGLAVDLYGPYFPEEHRHFLTAQSGPDVMRQAFDTMNYWTANIAKLRAVLAEWLQIGRHQPSVDPDACAAIGYCFGGLCCIEMVRAGLPIRGAVSFHGVLEPRVFSPPGRPIAMNHIPLSSHTRGAKILLEHGEDDHLVSFQSLAALQTEMDGAGVDLRIHHHKGVGHGFAIQPGRYFHPEADKHSTLHMLEFLRELISRGWAPRRRDECCWHQSEVSEEEKWGGTDSNSTSDQLESDRCSSLNCRCSSISPKPSIITLFASDPALFLEGRAISVIVHSASKHLVWTYTGWGLCRSLL
ncbi:unnamed protein product [Prorocentrum cordatum]|uniref:Dienelactone hydrolase domain-containing protein n=1 Tax=Prorocentrum cordatum TaxID=2364126 RepID=A0ABN9Q5I5_9DINO|nr:unnamed protein product [Polarella glacialis]